MRKIQTNEDIFYSLGKIILLPGILGAVFLRYIGREGLGLLPGCVFRRYTGLYCPGCGGTRAVYYLTQGQLIRSFLCHPFVLYMAVVYVAFMAVCFYRRHFSRKTYPPIRVERYAYVAIAILLFQFVVKNILLLGFHITWL